MNDRQLRTFLAVAEHGSFSRAEESEYISKQAMLRQMDALESEVGVPLLVRSASGVALTPAGEEFYQGARRLLKQGEQLVRKCRGTAGPTTEIIRIGQVEHQALLHRVTDAFAVKYPGIQIQKVIHPNHSGEYRVEHGIVDVGETFYTPAVAEQGNAYTKLADMPYWAAMRHAHPLSGRKALSLEELTGYPTTVFRPMLKPEYLEALKAAFQQAGSEERLHVRTDVDHQVEEAFSCGTSDGVLLTANCFILDIPEVVTVPMGNGWFQEYGIIYRPNPTPAVQKYVDLAVYLFREGMG